MSTSPRARVHYRRARTGIIYWAGEGVVFNLWGLGSICIVSMVTTKNTKVVSI